MHDKCLKRKEYKISTNKRNERNEERKKERMLCSHATFSILNANSESLEFVECKAMMQAIIISFLFLFCLVNREYA